MTKSDLITELAETLDVPRGRAKLIVDTVFNCMTGALERDEGIEIRGFASFSVRRYGAYTARNPKLGHSVHVAEKRLPFFRMGKELRELVNSKLCSDTKSDS